MAKSDENVTYIFKAHYRDRSSLVKDYRRIEVDGGIYGDRNRCYMQAIEEACSLAKDNDELTCVELAYILSNESIGKNRESYYPGTGDTGGSIGKYLQERHISVSELAQRLETGTDEVNEWLASGDGLKIRDVKRIADALGTSYRLLIDDGKRYEFVSPEEYGGYFKRIATDEELEGSGYGAIDSTGLIQMLETASRLAGMVLEPARKGKGFLAVIEYDPESKKSHVAAYARTKRSDGQRRPAES